MLRFQATRVGNEFNRLDCEGIPHNLCAQVYILSTLGTQEQWHENFEDPWMKSCGQSLSLEMAKEWGWKSWDLESQKVVDAAFIQLCQALPAAKSPSSK